jgi:hypothetical protein
VFYELERSEITGRGYQGYFRLATAKGLTIERIDNLCTATASPPHAERAWTTDRPMRRGTLKRVLIVRGGHVEDVVQLLDEVDVARASF